MQTLRVLTGLGLLAAVMAGCASIPDSITINLENSGEDVGDIVQATLQAMTGQAGGASTAATTPASPGAQTGSISGSLNYPSESLPAMYVTAFLVGTQNYQYVITNEGQQTYQIDGLSPGTYRIVAYTVGSQSFPAGLAGGYTQAVPCGLAESCTDHTLIDIPLAAGQNVTGINPADWYLVDGAFPAFPGQVAPTAAAGSGNGSISGNLMFPSEGIPALRIVAFRVGSNEYHFVDTVVGQSSYVMENVPGGTYHVVAYVKPQDGFAAGMAGGYSQMVPCGLQYGCNDHSLIDVVVTAGSTTSGVDPNDYYADPGTFPANPAP